MATDTKMDINIQELFEAGAHYGYKKTRRHPSTEQFVFGVKDGVEIFDLEKTRAKLDEALAFIKELGKEGKTVLFISSKPEAKEIILGTVKNALIPYVVERWIGGTITNFEEIQKRVHRLIDLKGKKEKGELAGHTKHERLMIDRDIERLERNFGGIVSLEKNPGAIFVIDPKEEHTAVREANRMHIPVIALANTDCDIEIVDYPIPANDANVRSISFFVKKFAGAYLEGKKEAVSQKESLEDKK